MNNNLQDLEKRICYSFRDRKLLTRALWHPSYCGEMHLQRCESNQRLEFLGDAVLELVISDYLYRTNRTQDEGELTRRRASLVFETALTVCARDIGLGDFIYLGKGEEKSGGREKPSILSDTFEALIGAVYLDGGIEKASDFIYEHVINDIDDLILMKDSKSCIQEIVQRKNGKTLEYRTAPSGGPDHEKSFVSELYIDGVLIAKGSGHSKKSAEQDAAGKAIMLMEDDPGEAPAGENVSKKY